MFRVSKMLFNGLMKSLNKNADFELLKAEVINILKKQAQNEKEDFKKSIIKSENLYSYLVKSTTGDFIMKSGYPIGTIREWKGKKYIKIAPKKWKRKFDKNDRGANISAGKLIKQVEKCESVEDLMKLVLANKQRFSDENGHPLPIVDKIRAAVDKKNESFDSESKTVKTPKTEKKNVEKLGKIPAKFELYRNVISNPETQSIESLKLAIEDMDKAKDNLELANLQEGGPTKKRIE